METDLLSIPIGTLEQESKPLGPKKVTIMNVAIEDVPAANGKKVVFEVKHPDREEGNIKLSTVNQMIDKKIKTTGTWYSLDSQGNLLKNSALGNFLRHIGANSIRESIGKQVDTELEGKYLVFKGY